MGVTSCRELCQPQLPGQIPSLHLSLCGAGSFTCPSPPAPPPVCLGIFRDHFSVMPTGGALPPPKAPPDGACLMPSSEHCSLRGTQQGGTQWGRFLRMPLRGRTSDSPHFRRQLATSCSPFPLKTKQGKMGLNCSKGDLGQIEERPARATGKGLWELMEFPSLEISGSRL